MKTNPEKETAREAASRIGREAWAITHQALLFCFVGSLILSLWVIFSGRIQTNIELAMLVAVTGLCGLFAAITKPPRKRKK